VEKAKEKGDKNFCEMVLLIYFLSKVFDGIIFLFFLAKPIG
jgi:hypothetical protein